MVFTLVMLSSYEISLSYILDTETWSIDRPVLEAKGFIELLAHEESSAASS